MLSPAEKLEKYRDIISRFIESDEKILKPNVQGMNEEIDVLVERIKNSEGIEITNEEFSNIKKNIDKYFEEYGIIAIDNMLDKAIKKVEEEKKWLFVLDDDLSYDNYGDFQPNFIKEDNLKLACKYVKILNLAFKQENRGNYFIQRDVNTKTFQKIKKKIEGFIKYTKEQNEITKVKFAKLEKNIKELELKEGYQIIKFKNNIDKKIDKKEKSFVNYTEKQKFLLKNKLEKLKANTKKSKSEKSHQTKVLQSNSNDKIEKKRIKIEKSINKLKSNKSNKSAKLQDSMSQKIKKKKNDFSKHIEKQNKNIGKKIDSCRKNIEKNLPYKIKEFIDDKFYKSYLSFSSEKSYRQQSDHNKSNKSSFHLDKIDNFLESKPDFEPYIRIGRKTFIKSDNNQKKQKDDSELLESIKSNRKKSSTINKKSSNFRQKIKEENKKAYTCNRENIR